MANFPIKTFLGLRQTADPEVGTATVASNFKRNKVRGRLESVDGIALLDLYSPLGVLPIDDTTVRLIDNLSWKKPFSFYIADEGGSTVYAVTATYRKTAHGFTGAGSTLNTSGVWINRYYASGTWIAGWRELTEFYIFRYQSAANITGETMDITLETSGGQTPAMVSSLIGEGFVVVKNGDFTDTQETGFKVVSMSGTELRVIGQTGDIAGWIANTTKLYVYRNNFNKVLPSSLVTQFRNVLDELRVNTGNTTNDLDISVFYRNKTFFPGNTLTRKGTFGEFGQLTIPTPTFKILNPSITSAGSNGFPAGTYTLRATMLMDDGQETELRDPLVGSFPETLGLVGDTPLGFNATTSITKSATHIYAVSYLSTGTYNYIWKIDSNGVVINTVQLTTSSDGAIVAAHYGSDGFLYVLVKKSGDARLLKYDADLNVVASGSWYTLSISDYVSGAASDNSFFMFTESATQYQLIRFDLYTLAFEEASQLTTASILGSGYIAASNSYVVVTGLTGCLKYAAYFGSGDAPLSNVYTGMGSVSTSAVTILGGDAYVGATTILKKWVLSSDTITNHWTGGSSAGWFGLNTDGATMIYGKNNDVLRKINTSGSQLATYTETAPADLAGPLTILSNRVYALTQGAKLRIFNSIPTGSSFISSGTEGIGYDLAVSPGYIPRRGKSVRLYINKDGGTYYFIKEHLLLTGGETFSATSVWNATVKHRYFVSTGLTLTGTDYSAATVSATAQLGRINTDTGINRYSFAIIANSRTYAVGMYIGGRLLGNKVFMNAISGDGVSQYDVLPNDVTTVLDVEFNDGAYAVALGNVADRILVLKNKALVMLTANADGTHSRDIVATGVGIASADSLVAFNEALYWLDHTGVWEFTTRGLRNIGESITSTILGYTDTQRTQAFGVIDPRNLQYRLMINSVWHVYDIKDGEWMTEAWGGMTPAAAAEDVGNASRRYMTLVSNGYLWKPVEAILLNGNNIAASWQSNKIELPLERGYDGLVAAIYCDYSSTVNLTLSLYLNDAGSPVRSWTLPSTGNGVVVPAPLSARCKSFRLAIGGTLVSNAQTISIRRLGAYYNQIPVGGDQQIT